MTLQILIGDVRDVLKTLADKSVQMVVTSPPYYALRDYLTGIWEGGDPACVHLVGKSDLTIDPKAPGKGERLSRWGDKWNCPCGARRVDQQIGLEATPEAFIIELCRVFRELHRVLKDDGTLWLNIGDTSASSGGMGYGENKFRVGRARQQRGVRQGQLHGLKRKDVIGIPWWLATALRDGFHRCSSCEVDNPTFTFPAFDGRRWCMPCLVAGREHIVERTFRGWYLRQEIIWHKKAPMPSSTTDKCTQAHEPIFLLAKSRHYYFDAAAIKEPASENTNARMAQNIAGQNGSARANGGTRAERPMKAVTSKMVVGKQDGPRVKHNDGFTAATSSVVVTMANKRSVWSIGPEGFSGDHHAVFPTALVVPCVLAGSRPGDLVLDCFGGSGTTAVVADRLGRDCILIELSEKSAAVARDRVGSERGVALKGAPAQSTDDLPLFTALGRDFHREDSTA